MSNFRKFISLSAIAVLGVTNLLTPLSYASAATKYDALTSGDLATHNLNFEMPDKDVYLYAHTEANHYFVEYSGTTKTALTMENGEFIYDKPNQHLSGNAYAKTGYTFSGWNTDPNGSGTSYEDEALVDNWTTGENVTVPIYAQWNPNRYYITYNLNDSEGTSSGVHSQTPTSGLYDETLTILNPSRTGYIFSGWKITGMDSETHVISGVDYNGETKDHESATSYKNLHASGGTVNFMANWDKDKVRYVVEHFKETFKDDEYTILMSGDTVDTSGRADTNITPEVKTYEGFTSPDAITTGIKADGTTYVRYNYDRNSYRLEFIAGRGIMRADVEWPSDNTDNMYMLASASEGMTDRRNIKYEKPVKLSFVLKDGYENGTWSGYQDTASGFNMPAEDISKTAYATPIVYHITYVYSGGKPDQNPTSYTIESGQIVIPALDRVHSYFDGWIGGVDGGLLASAQQTVTIPAGSTGDRTYVATWSCYPGYHLSSDGAACNPDSDTEYRVKHYLQDFDGQYNILSGPSIGYTVQTGETDQVTDAHPLVFEGFEVAHIDTGIIKGYEPGYSGITYVDITYNRLKYEGSTEITTGVTSITHVGANDGQNGTPAGSHQYNDVVTITATTGAGYTFSGWTIEDGSGNDITAQLLSGDEITSTTATFNMPASEVVIKARVDTNVYDLTIISHGGENGSTSRTYTVEDTVELTNPTRDHSDFAGWSGTEVTDPMHVVFSGRAYDSVYEETWRCHTGYHMSGANECVANTYNVEVDHNDGTHSAPDKVVFTYDEWQKLPTPEQSGYDFTGWKIEGMSGGVTHYIGTITVNEDGTYTYSGAEGSGFMNLTTVESGTVTFTALWSPRNDTKYVIYHYYRDVNATTYTLSGTDELSGTTDTDVVFAEKLQNYSGFTYTGGFVNITSTPTAGLPNEPKVTTGNIHKDGSLKIYLYYDRNRYDVNLSGDAHVATLTGAGTYDFQADVTVDMTAKTGYHFTNWTKEDHF